MKRRRINKKKVILLIFILFIILGGIIFILINFNKKKVSKDNDIINSKEEKEYSINMLMVGDLLVHDRLYNAMKTSDGYDFKPVLTYIKDIVKDYDVAYYNQETILGGSEIGLSSYPAFNSPYEVGEAMIDAGFNLVSLATNHTLDRGEKAITNSVNYWNKQANVLAVGSYLSNEERNEIRIKEKNNITYTMLNYTYGTNGIKVPSGKDYLVNIWPCTGNNPSTDTKYQEYKDKVKEDIDRVRDKVDLLIVAMHWGIEYTHIPTSYQIDMANYLSSLGVDIIIGTHPHVVMPITYINDTLVIYSLGNFLSAQETNIDYNTTVGLLSTVTITKYIDKDNNTSIKLSNQNNELIYTYSKNNKDYKVIPFSNPDIKTYLNDYERVYNKYVSIITNMDNNIKVKSIAS
ncbi:putative uncharacterized protein [Firmicutes bacterium CAG:321]|nr:putative uncharacterized protein [Firmicutes bacterium CAG:321]